MNPRSRRRSSAVPVALLSLGTALTWSISAQAQEWRPVAPGVEHAGWTDGGSSVFVTKIDLCAPGIRMRATAPGEGPRTVSSFGSMVGAAAAINGDWWSNDGEAHLPDTYPRGLAVGDGNHFPGTVDRPFYGVVAFGPSIALHSVMEEDLGGPHFWMQEVVSGQPTLVWQGQLRDNPSDHCGVRRARTAIGFELTLSTMFLGVVQEVGGSVGKTCNEMASFMQSLGAYSALNQDGGGSSTMWLHDAGVVNSPTDGQERSLVNHWAVLASGWGPPHSCPTRDIPTPEEGERRLVSSEAMSGWGFVGGDLGFMAPETFDAYPEGSPLPEAPTYLQHSDSSLWRVDGAFRRHVQSFYAIATWRIDVEADASKSADEQLDALIEGPAVTETPILVIGEDLSVWLIDARPPEETTGSGASSGATTSSGGAMENLTGGVPADSSSGGCGACTAAPPNRHYGWLALSLLGLIWAQRRSARRLPPR